MSKDFLGKGWRFPVGADLMTGAILMSEYEQDIKESIQIILSTEKGERVMRQDFGCDISNYVFSPINVTTMSLIEASARDALVACEPRIKIKDVKASPDEAKNIIYVNIEYTVSKTNNHYNMVYPFYLKES